MSDQDDKKQQKLNIQIDDDVAQGIYSNLAIINHSQTEFVLDFVNIMPGSPKNKVRSRIILTPQHAKRLLRALNDNINRFEKSQGPIKEQEKTNIPMNFGGPTGEA
ncbi:DUF3467 domain-containing protein [Psychroflexus sp. CAK57W]|uniref:DUF3467 domain-containing protein n=1 Tax=Psychroflexus curvus TaxID=2873595 RepID=UPI001CD004CA|nr:DUF3467 domain-containing protein [Psychroflexus curvus]MBZ9628098.1 DUF3467 domain-containing protein [Psychroflexus curvus]MBZ9787797.1 DUF3467 domain-containing protein [Psychroflexus curvus]